MHASKRLISFGFAPRLAMLAIGTALLATILIGWTSYRAENALIARLGADPAGAGVNREELRATSHANLVRLILTGVVVAGVVGLLGAFAGRALARPVCRLTDEIKTFTDDDFSNDDEAIFRLKALAAKDRSEIGELARTFVYLQENLVAHFVKLTNVTREKHEIVSQLNIARKIQRDLLPAAAPKLIGYDIAGFSEAADQTGGDFYDWNLTPTGQLVVNVADVTGHGIGPAIMASVCRAYARATLYGPQPLETLVEKLNQLVHADTHGQQFVTFFTGVLDPISHSMLIVSAGHGPLLLYRARSGAIEEIETHGPPLGILEQFTPDPGSTIVFEPDDILLLVSDGFFEWMNASHEQFGTTRLAASLQKSCKLESHAIIEHIRQEVTTFTTGTRQPDDMTAVVIKRL